MVFTSGKGRHCIALIAATLAIVLLLSGCVDVYSGRRPFDYPNSVWVCEDPYIKIIVDDAKNMYSIYDCGKGKTVIMLAFDFGRGIVAFAESEENDVLFRGNCRFGERSFRVTVIEDNLWGGEYDVLCFARIE